jgi:hypothetical protein
MSKFTFTCVDDEPSAWGQRFQSTTTKEFEAVTLDRILPEFETFLRGCGFEFDGHLDWYTPDTDKEPYQSDLEKEMEKQFKEGNTAPLFHHPV